MEPTKGALTQALEFLIVVSLWRLGGEGVSEFEGGKRISKKGIDYK